MPDSGGSHTHSISLSGISRPVPAGHATHGNLGHCARGLYFIPDSKRRDIVHIVVCEDRGCTAEGATLIHQSTRVASVSRSRVNQTTFASSVRPGLAEPFQPASEVDDEG